MNKHSLLILTALVFSIFFTLLFQIDVKAGVCGYYEDSNCYLLPYITTEKVLEVTYA
jgi:hypothetical protein